MQAVSDEFLAALRGPHNLAIKAVLTTADGASYDLPIMDGQVVIDRTAEHRRQLDLTIPPMWPAGHPLEGLDTYPDTPSDPVNVTGAEIQVWRGIRFGNEAKEFVSLGVYRIQDASRATPGGPVQITGWDRSFQVADQRFLAPRKFAAQIATTLMSTLITEVYPDAVITDNSGDSTTLHKHVVDRDRWPEVQRIAQAIGCEVYPDATGDWVIQPVPDLSTADPVWTTDAGEGGVLISVNDTVTRDGVPSVVVALGESWSGDAKGITISHASPAVVTLTNHQLVSNAPITFGAPGTASALPDPLKTTKTYYVNSVLSADTFTISTTTNGSNIDTTSAGTAPLTANVTSIPVHSNSPHGYDDDANSPTYYLGAFGKVARFYSNPHIKTQGQANRVADAQFADHKGLVRSVSLNAIPNPALEAGDCILLIRPDGTREQHLIDSITIGLSPSGEMTCETRAQTWDNAE